jgi:hypothetical protein
MAALDGWKFTSDPTVGGLFTDCTAVTPQQ